VERGRSAQSDDIGNVILLQPSEEEEGGHGTRDGALL